MGVLKSLESYEFIVISDIPNTASVLTSEGLSYVEADASPEAQVFKAAADAHAAGTPATVASLKEALGSVSDIGFKQAMQQKWETHQQQQAQQQQQHHQKQQQQQSDFKTRMD